MSPEVPQPEVPHTAEEISPRAPYSRPALIRLDLRRTEQEPGYGGDGDDFGRLFVS